MLASFLMPYCAGKKQQGLMGTQSDLTGGTAAGLAVSHLALNIQTTMNESEWGFSRWSFKAKQKQYTLRGAWKRQEKHTKLLQKWAEVQCCCAGWDPRCVVRGKVACCQGDTLRKRNKGMNGAISVQHCWECLGGVFTCTYMQTQHTLRELGLTR